MGEPRSKPDLTKSGGSPLTRSRFKGMRVYTKDDFARIGEAVGKSANEVEACWSKFEAAAMWFRSVSRNPERLAPSKAKRKLVQISKRAQRLLAQLGIDDPLEAPDGPGDRFVFDLLMSVDGMTEDKVASITARIGEMAVLLEGIEAVLELNRLAREAGEDVEHWGRLTARKGHQGDAALNGWIAELLEVYSTITGSRPATSVGGPGKPNEGIADGPLIRFLIAASAPLGIELGTDALRSRIRTILASKP